MKEKAREEHTMPNTTAAKKANRQNEARKNANKARISRIKTERKKFDKSAASNSAQVTDHFSSTQSLLAKAAKSGVMHWKKAARLVSRMAGKIAQSSTKK